MTLLNFPFLFYNILHWFHWINFWRYALVVFLSFIFYVWHWGRILSGYGLAYTGYRAVAVQKWGLNSKLVVRNRKYLLIAIPLSSVRNLSYFFPFPLIGWPRGQSTFLCKSATGSSYRKAHLFNIIRFSSFYFLLILAIATHSRLFILSLLIRGVMR